MIFLFWTSKSVAVVACARPGAVESVSTRGPHISVPFSHNFTSFGLSGWTPDPLDSLIRSGKYIENLFEGRLQYFARRYQRHECSYTSIGRLEPGARTTGCAFNLAFIFHLFYADNYCLFFLFSDHVLQPLVRLNRKQSVNDRPATHVTPYLHRISQISRMPWPKKITNPLRLRPCYS